MDPRNGLWLSTQPVRVFSRSGLALYGGRDRCSPSLGSNNGVLNVVIPIPEALPLKAREVPVTEGSPAKAETTQ